MTETRPTRRLTISKQSSDDEQTVVPAAYRPVGR